MAVPNFKTECFKKETFAIIPSQKLQHRRELIFSPKNSDYRFMKSISFSVDSSLAVFLELPRSVSYGDNLLSDGAFECRPLMEIKKHLSQSVSCTCATFHSIFIYGLFFKSFNGNSRKGTKVSTNINLGDQRYCLISGNA